MKKKIHTRFTTQCRCEIKHRLIGIELSIARGKKFANIPLILIMQIVAVKLQEH